MTRPRRSPVNASEALPSPTPAPADRPPAPGQGRASALALTPDPANPNRMAPDDKARMAKSLAEFGDLSPVILNIRTGLLVGGHQRVDVLRQMLDAGEGVLATIIDQRFDPPTRTGTVALGKVEFRGEWWSYREVDWAPDKAHAALLAANRFGRVGEDDPALLKDILEQLDTGATDMDLTGYTAEAIEGLMTQVRVEEPGEKKAFDAGSQYGVIVMCENETAQKDAYEKLLALGYSVKVVCV